MPFGSGFADQDRAQHDRHPDGARGPVDRRGGVGVAQRVDVGGVLRPQHHVRARAQPGGDVGGELLGDPHVVVEHRPALRVEVQTQPRHVALHGCDRHRADGSRPRRRQQRGERACRERDERQQRGRGGAPLATGEAARGLAEREPGQHRREGQQRRPADGGHRQQRPVGLTERDPAPREPAEGRPRPQRLYSDPHRGRPERCRPSGPRAQPRHHGRPGARGTDEDRLGARERQPRHRADVDAGPAQQRQEEAQPEQRAQPESGAGGPPVHGRAEQPERGQREPPQRARREPRVEQHPAADRGRGAGEEGHEGPPGARRTHRRTRPDAAGSAIGAATSRAYVPVTRRLASRRATSSLDTDASRRRPADGDLRRRRGGRCRGGRAPPGHRSGGTTRSRRWPRTCPRGRPPGRPGWRARGSRTACARGRPGSR